MSGNIDKYICSKKRVGEYMCIHCGKYLTLDEKCNCLWTVFINLINDAKTTTFNRKA